MIMTNNNISNLLIHNILKNLFWKELGKILVFQNIYKNMYKLIYYLLKN